jgi:iron complex outermembrane receptor protein
VRIKIYITSIFLILIYLVQPVNGQEVEKTIILDSVVIEDEILDEVKYVASSYVTKKDLQNQQIRDLGEYLRTIPNVSGIRKGGANLDPVVRGYKFSQLNVLLNNGVKIENGCPNRMDPVTARIETEDIGSIEVIKGPFLLKYGPSFGGVINLKSEIPKSYDQFEIHGSAQAGFESNWNGEKYHGSVHGGGSKFHFMVSGGYRNYGNYNSGYREGMKTEVKSSFTKYNYLAKLEYSFKPNQQLLISYDGVHGRDVLYPSLPMDEKSDDTHIFSLDYEGKNLSPVLKSIEAKIYHSDVHHVMDNSRRPSSANMLMVADVNSSNTGGRFVTTFQFAKHRLLSGLDYEHIMKDGARTGTMEMMGTISTKVSNLWLDALIRNTGFFAEYHTFFSSYELNASLRGDFNNATSSDTLEVSYEGIDYFKDVDSEFFNLSFNVGITKKISSNLDISLAFGRGSRSPNMLERYIKLLPVGYDRYDYLGNPQLQPETNNEIDLTFQSNFRNFGSMYLNFFYSYVQDYIYANLLPPTVIMPQTQGVLGVKQFVNVDHITSAGFEFGYNSPHQYKLGGSVVAAFTYGIIPEVTKYIISDGEVVDAVQITNDALPEIPPFETTLTVFYKFLNSNLIPTLKLRVVAPQRHISQAFYEEETPGFALLNFSIRWKFAKFMELNTGVSNIFDRAYYEHLNRRIIGSKENLYEPGRVFFASIYAHF